MEYVAGKTKDSSLKVLHVPLMSISKEILDRYPEGPKLLPFISAQRYNHAIKKIFKAAGVTRMVTVIDPLTREEKQVPINENAEALKVVIPYAKSPVTMQNYHKNLDSERIPAIHP